MTDLLKIAHRGSSELYGDNNMTSFQKAYEEGFDVIELDIQLNKDNEIVVYHDLHIHGVFVSEMSHKQTKDHGILLLKNVFEEFRYASIILYLDLKGNVKLSEILIKFIVLMKFPQDRLWIASFNKNHLYTFMCSPLKVILGFITTNDFYSHEHESLLHNIDFVCCNIHILSQRFVENLKELNKEVFVYTGENTYDIEYIKKFSVDGIVTNFIF